MLRRKRQPQALSSCPWCRYVDLESCHYIRPLTRTLDGLDLLLRIRTHRISPPHPRLLRSAQRRRTLSQQQIHVTTPTPTGHHPFKQPPTSNVQRKPACGLRNIVPRDWIRRRRSRPTKQSFSISLPSTIFYTWWCISARNWCCRKPATN
jgi:hypothetical protein